MSSEIAIKIENLGKCYQIYNKPHDRLKQSLYPRVQQLVGAERKHYYREFWALQDVSFDMAQGETVAIIGRNGSGKSTLLQMICGTLSPTTGTVQVAGRIAALLELGSGFNPEFTGRENVYMNAAVLGLSNEEIDARFEEIAAFAEIGDFIEQPVKTYSSGMMVRLAFAVSVCVDPDVLVIDEALAVGDAIFQVRCLDRIKRLAASGTTLLFVSHDMGMVKTFCDRAVYLEHGQVKQIGLAEDVVEQYFLDTREEQRKHLPGSPPVTRKQPLRGTGFAFGTSQGQIVSASFLPSAQADAVIGIGEEVCLQIETEFDDNLPGPTISVFLMDRRLVNIGGRAFPLEPIPAGTGKSRAELLVAFKPRLFPGQYFITLRLETRGMDGVFFPIDKQVGQLSLVIPPEECNFLGMVDLEMTKCTA